MESVTRKHPSTTSLKIKTNNSISIINNIIIITLITLIIIIISIISIIITTFLGALASC